MKVPPAVVGKKPTPEQEEAVIRFLIAHPDRKLAGLLLTARLFNEAIDWFNEERSDARHQ